MYLYDGKNLCKTSLQEQKAQKQGRDEDVQEDYPSTEQQWLYVQKMQVAFLSFFSAITR